MSDKNIDSKFEVDILFAIDRYRAEMIDRFYTDGDPSLNNKGLWFAQVDAACRDLHSALRDHIESAFTQINNDLDDGEYMSSNEVKEELKVQEHNFQKSTPADVGAPGIIPLVELCKVPG